MTRAEKLERELRKTGMPKHIAHDLSMYAVDAGWVSCVPDGCGDLHAWLDSLPEHDTKGPDDAR